QLMGLVLALSRLLTNPIEAVTQDIAAAQQCLTLFAVQRHGVQRILQLQARFPQLLGFQRSLLAEFAQFLVQPLAPQAQLLQLGPAGQQLCLEFALLTRFVLMSTTLLIANLLLHALGLAELLQTVLELSQAGFSLIAFGIKVFQFLAARQHAGFRLSGTPHPQEMPAEPVTVAADE